MENCPCFSGKLYEECCKPVHEGKRKAETAEELMRARYSAFAVQNIEFIMNTVNPEREDNMTEDQIRRWSERSTWQGLDVLKTELGGPEDEQGFVEFVATYSESGVKMKHHERAEFLRVNGDWVFEDGKPVFDGPVRNGTKVGRNDPCPCGSGKKFKKCCG